MYGSYRGCGACMGLTGVVVHAWVLQGLCDVHGSYRGCVTCMGPTGVVVCAWVVVRAWVLQGW